MATGVAARRRCQLSLPGGRCHRCVYHNWRRFWVQRRCGLKGELKSMLADYCWGHIWYAAEVTVNCVITDWKNRTRLAPIFQSKYQPWYVRTDANWSLCVHRYDALVYAITKGAWNHWYVSFEAIELSAFLQRRTDFWRPEAVSWSIYCRRASNVGSASFTHDHWALHIPMAGCFNKVLKSMPARRKYESRQGVPMGISDQTYRHSTDDPKGWWWHLSNLEAKQANEYIPFLAERQRCNTPGKPTRVSMKNHQYESIF